MTKSHYHAAHCLLAVLALSGLHAAILFDDLEKRANAGDAEAQFELGRAYEDGSGVRQDNELAAKWYRKSAEQGNAGAQNSLGVLYQRGRGVSHDSAEAFRWYLRAAKQALPDADFNIAISYYNGDGVVSDLNLAFAWMVIAKQHGSKSAEEGLPRIIGDLGGRVEEGTMLLGKLYEAGDQTPKDLHAAFEIYSQLANSNHKRGPSLAQLKLCEFYGNGMGTPQDWIQAKSWCKTAAKGGYAQAFIALGRMAENGMGAERNLKEAEQWYRDAAFGMVQEGFMSFGRLKLASGSHADQRDAYYWFFLASIYGIPGAAEQLKKAASNLSNREVSEEQERATKLSRTPSWKWPKPTYPQ